MLSFPAWLPGHMFILGGVSVPGPIDLLGGMSVSRGGVSVWGGGSVQGVSVKGDRDPPSCH